VWSSYAVFDEQFVTSGPHLASVKFSPRDAGFPPHYHAGCTKFILCVVVHVLCVYASKLLSGFFGTRSGFFGEDRLAILLCSLTRFDLANRGVRQPVQLHTDARLLVFDETLAQPQFAVVNCSYAVMSVFYSPFLTRSQTFAVMNSCVAALSLFSSDILSWSADSLFSVQ